jgi:predicted dienelactone hydrolase
MRTLEIVLLLLSGILPLLSSKYLLKLSLKSRQISIAVYCITLLIHLIFEGYRWQVVPIYVLSLFILTTLIRNTAFFGTSILKKTAMAFVMFFALLLGSFFSVCLPIFELPQPTGSYSVGALHYHLKTSAPETITLTPKDNRELMLKIWYPAILENEPTESYLSKAERVGFAHKYGLPAAALNYLDYIKTHTYKMPKVAQGKFPVLVFSPGIYSNATGYYALLEELSSHGFIIVNINPTYESTGSSFPDGTMQFYDHVYDKKYNTKAMGKLAWESTQDYLKANSKQEEFEAVEKLLRNYVANDITKRWAKDISLVIDHLNGIGSTIELTQHMDLNEIAAFGHSQGGAAAAQALIEDARITAALNIDGVQWGTVLDTSFSKPFASLSSDWSKELPDLNEHIYRNGSSTDFYKGKVLYSGHASFMDIPLMINIPIINEAGTIEPGLAHKISSTFVLHFFEQYLKDQPDQPNQTNQLIELTETFEELTVKMNS